MLRGVLILALAFPALTGRVDARTVNLIVATNGNDQWSGLLEKAAADGRDGPVATLQAALAKARAARNDPVDPADRVRILLRGGTYSVTAPIVLGAGDSGTSRQQRLIISAFRNETPVLSGGRRISGWKPVPGQPGLWSAEIPEARFGGWNFKQLFLNGRRMVRARTPNHGFLQIDGEPLSENPVRFKFRGTDLRAAWTAPRDVEVVGLQKWVDFRQPLREVDEEAHTATLGGSISPHVKEANARYHLENRLEFLDAAGEWFLDPQSGLVTFWPENGEDPNVAEVIAPVLSSELVRLEGDPERRRPLQHVLLRGLTFAYTDWSVGTNGYTDVQAAVGIRGDVRAELAVDCAIEDCRFTHLGGYALELGRGCQRFQIVGNEFVDLGAGGIRIGETTVRTEAFEQNTGHVVMDNHLHQLGRVFAPAVGIIIFQSGQNQISHNHIHDLYYTAISVGWNWGYQETPCRENIVEFNHLHDIGQGRLSDMGGIYTLGIQNGTILRNNRIHDVVSHGYGGWGLYTDEGSSGILLENNIVYRCQSASFHQHYGRDNVVRNNILAFGKEHQLMRTREESHNSFIFERNVVYFDSGVLLGSNWSNDRFRMERNNYFDTRLADTPEAIRFGTATLAEWRLHGHDLRSLFEDPQFVDPRKDDFRLPTVSPVFKLGFQPIDSSSIGIRKSYRKRVRDTD